MKSFFELFIKQKIEFKFVLFSIGQTLCKCSYNSIKRTCSIKQPDLEFFKKFIKPTVLSLNTNSLQETA